MAGGRADVVSSFELAGTDEARLFGGALLALVVYALWVGLSGAALTFGANALEVPLSPRPWSGLKTGMVVVASLAWVVVPAAVAARLLVGQLTNASGNLTQRYRYRHPAVLLVPPALLLAVAVGAVVALDGAWPLLVVFVFAALFLLVRTVAYSYRVFALSVPVVMQAVTVLSLLPLTVALLVGGATLAGRRAYVVAVLDGFGGAVGVESLGSLVAGSVAVATVDVPTAVAATVATAVGLSAAYLVAQTVAGLAARNREPDVRRSELRTGQRYPDFARPTTDVQADTVSGSSPSTDETGSDAGSATAGDAPEPSETAPDSTDDRAAVGSTPGEDPQSTLTDDVSNTRVYTPPGDGSDSAESDDADGRESTDAPDQEPEGVGTDDDAPATDADAVGTDGDGDAAPGRVGANGGTGSATGDGSTDATPDDDGSGRSRSSGDGNPEDDGDVCPSCGASHDPGASFCSTCGTELE